MNPECYACKEPFELTDHLWALKAEDPSGKEEFVIVPFCDDCGPNFIDLESGGRPFLLRRDGLERMERPQ